MKLTQPLITDIGILVLGFITAVTLVRAQSPIEPMVIPTVPAETQRLINETTDPIAAFRGGKEFAAKGDLLAAAAAFKKTTHLDREWRDAFVMLGQIYIALAEQAAPFSPGDLTWWEKAEHALTRAKKLDSIYKPTYDYLTIVFEKTGQREKLSELKTTLKNLPNLN